MLLQVLKATLGIVLFSLTLSLPAISQSDTLQNKVNQCNIKGHLKCINISGKEVFRDGAEGNWSDHWWQMSYIGRACQEEQGRTIGVLVESLFVIPHYLTIGVINLVGFVKFGLTTPLP